MNKIEAGAVVTGQKIRARVADWFGVSVHEGIVVAHDVRYNHAVYRVDMTLWSWEGYEEITVWEIDMVDVL